MAKDDGLPGAPIFIVNFGAVVRADCAHDGIYAGVGFLEREGDGKGIAGLEEVGWGNWELNFKIQTSKSKENSNPKTGKGFLAKVED